MATTIMTANVIPDHPTIFLSGTYTDLKEYREAVRESIYLAGAFVQDFKHWNGPHIQPREEIRHRIEQLADMFVGVFGLQYGELLTDEEPPKSLSHYEYELAQRRWPHSPGGTIRPLYVFWPDPECDDWARIAQLSRDAAAKRYDDDPVKVDEDLRHQKQLLEEVERRGVASPFCGIQDLCVRVVASIKGHRGDLYKQRYAELSTELRHYTELVDMHLERLGCKPQIDAAEDACERFWGLASERAPGMCLLAWGKPYLGQGQLAGLAPKLDGFEEARPLLCVLHGSEDPCKTLWSELWRAATGDAMWGSKDTSSLADALAQACLGDPIMMVLENVQLYPGGLEGFAGQVWGPLAKSLSVSWTRTSRAQQFCLLATADVPDGKLPESGFWTGALDAANVDYGLILPLPELVALDENDIVDGLESLGMSRRLRKQVAVKVLEKGDPDGVHTRLRRHPVVIERLQELERVSGNEI